MNKLDKYIISLTFRQPSFRKEFYSLFRLKFPYYEFLKNIKSESSKE